MGDWVKNIIITLFAAITGAAATWYVGLPNPAILVYNISTTTTGSDSTTQSIVPGLAIRIGDEPIAAIHTHTIDLTPHFGYAESATIAINFGTTPRFFGHRVESPTSLHTFDCRTLDRGFQCELK